MTDVEYKQMCDRRRGSGNPQYGNVGRITGSKNPMHNMTVEAKAAWLVKQRVPASPAAKIAIGIAARDIKRRKVISDKMQGNTSNQVWTAKIEAMTDSEVEDYILTCTTKCRVTQVRNIRNPPEPKELRVPFGPCKEATRKRLTVRLQELTNEQFFNQMEGKGKKYIKKQCRARYSKA